MAYTEHTIVKPQKMAATAAQMLEQSLTLPATFQRESFDNYKGAEDDAVNVTVEGVLPFHNYAFRNDRSAELEVDTYAERKIQVTLGDNFYSNVHLTDEQKDFDLLGWGKVLRVQTKAIARGLQRGAASHIENAAYAVKIGDAGTQLLRAITEARRVLNRFQVPDGERFMVVGSDFEAAMQEDPKLTIASNAGDSQADSALHDATLGRIKGFTIVLDNTIQPDAAYCYVDGAFVWANAAPSVPQSAPYGATTAFEDVALRVIQDYDSQKMKDRQVVNTWSGFRTVSDILVGWDDATKSEVVWTLE